ncbi:MAG: DUF4956 domain-containing protein [Kiritimatiellae bacterium]|nr:DUF4956 domain-containing protein [Kiritimatiellia bacterium]
MEDFLTVFGPAQSQLLGFEQIIISFLFSFILSSVLATVYRWTFQGFSYSRSFIHTMVLGSLVVCMLILAIGNNLARGLGILGTLAIIRFRTPIRDPRDIIFLFACLGLGIACGAQTYTVAITGTVFVSLTAILLHWSPFASRRSYDGLLRFLVEPETEFQVPLDEMLRACCTAYYLIAVREGVQGDKLEYSYQVRLRDPSYQDDLLDGIHSLEMLSDVNLLMQRTTVEL